MQIEIIEPKKEYTVMTKEELAFYQPEPGQVFELTYLERCTNEPREITNVFMLADTIGASSYLIDLKTGLMEKTLNNNPLANAGLKITKVSYFESSKLILKRGGC